MKSINFTFFICLLLAAIYASVGPVYTYAASCPNNISCALINNGSSSATSTSTNCANFCCINVTNSITVQETLTASCETITGNLTVGGTVTIEGSLITEGNSDFRGSVTVGQDLNVGGNATIGGNEIVDGSLSVGDGAYIAGPLVVNGNETVTGNLSVSLSETVNGNLSVNGSGTVNGLLSANGGLLVINGETIANGGLVVASGGASINGNVVVNGDLSVDDLDILVDLTVAGNAFFNGCNTTVNGTLISNGPVILNDGLTIAGGNETITSGNLTLGSGSLTVGGQSVFNGPVTATDSVTINDSLTVFGGSTIATGGLTLGNCGNLTIGGQLIIGNSISSPARATLFGLTITDTTNSTSPSTGALIVNGGVGIGADLWLGGSEYFQNVFTQGGIPSAFNYYEEACFPMIFTFAGAPSITVQVQVVRIGNLVNLLIPALIFALGGTGLVTSTNTIPARFAPGCTVRGASSTVVNNASQLGEYQISPSGTITIGLPGPALGPQAFTSTTGPQVDINTITYNRLTCGCS